MPFQEEIPNVWKKLGMWFHQDFFVCFPDPNDGISAFWKTVSKSEKVELLGFLQKLNEESCMGGMPKKYWKLSGAQVTPANIKVFLKELQAKFETL